MEELLGALPLPTFQQFIFVQIALFTALMALLVVVAKNLFHSALSLVGTLFGVAGIYVLLEAEFLAVSQILVYVGGISTLITFAIMLTRSMMFGDTAPVNRQAGTAAIIIGTLFSVLAGLMVVIPWPGPAESLQPAMAISDVAAMVAGEKSLDIIIAETDLTLAGTALADAEKALVDANDASPVVEAAVTKTEEDLAQAKLVQIEAESRLAANQIIPAAETAMIDAEATLATAREALMDAERTATDAAVITQAEADVTEAESVLSQASSALVEARASVAEIQGRWERVIDGKSPIAEQVDAEADVADADAESTDAETDVADADAEQVDAETDVADADAESTDAETDVADADAEQVGAETDVADADAESTDAETDVADADAEQVDAETDVADADAESTDAEMNVAGAEQADAVVSIAIEEPSFPLVERNGRGDGEVLIAGMGQLFVTTYLVPFELMALLLLVVLAGAIMLARDRA